MIRFTLWLPYRREITPNPLNMKQVWTFWRRNTFSPNRIWTSNRPASSLVAIPTDLSRLVVIKINSLSSSSSSHRHRCVCLSEPASGMACKQISRQQSVWIRRRVWMATQNSRRQAVRTARCGHGHLASQRIMRWRNAHSDPRCICSKQCRTEAGCERNVGLRCAFTWHHFAVLPGSRWQ